MDGGGEVILSRVDDFPSLSDSLLLPLALPTGAGKAGHGGHVIGARHGTDSVRSGDSA